MPSESDRFRDPLDDLLKNAEGMSDRDLERMLAGQELDESGSAPADELEPGTEVEGIVVEFRGGDVLVELGGKVHGVIAASEYGDEANPPAPGESIRATFIRFDSERELAILSVHGVRLDVTWDDLVAGTVVEGMVTAVNKGGLTLDVKGIRAFLPVSRIERGRVEEPESYLGQKLRCEVLSVDRSDRDVVLDRRAILEREAEVVRESVFATLVEGQELRGKVVRLTDHGAFVDLGGVDGLLPASKIRAHSRAGELEETLQAGQEIQVQILRLDLARQRVSLDFKQVEADTWGHLIEHYAVGDQVTGWVSRRDPDGLILSVEEGVEGLLPEGSLHLLSERPEPGSILKVVVASIDPQARRLTLAPPKG